MRGAGMAQTVWAIMWQATAKCSNVNGDARGSAVRCHGSIGCAQPKEKKAGGPLGSHALEIFQNCVAHLGGEWIFLNSLVLRRRTRIFSLVQSRSSSVNLQTSPMRRP